MKSRDLQPNAMAVGNTSSKPHPINISALPQRQREAIRLRMYDLWKEGLAPRAAAAKLNVKTITVAKNFARFATRGKDAAFEKPHGFELLSKPLLSREEIDALASAITRGDIHDFVPIHDLWSPRAVVSFFRKNYGKTLTRTKALAILHRLGFSLASPMPRRTKPVRDWMARTYPLVRALAQRRHALIVWCAETTADHGPGKHKTTPLPDGLAIPCRIFSAMSNYGEIFFRRLDGDVTAGWFSSFAEGLWNELGQRPLILILEDSRWTRAADFQEWCKAIRDQGRIWVRFHPHLPHPKVPVAKRAPQPSLEDILDQMH